MGTELTDIFMALHPRDQWTRASSQAELTALVEAAMHGLPGIRTVLTQPIELRVNEMLSGIRADVGIKIYGDDFVNLVALGDQVEHLLLDVPGAADISVEQITGQPTLQIKVDQEQLARFGVPAKDVLDVVAAVGSTRVGEVFEGERAFPLVVRLPDSQRGDVATLRETLIPTRTGAILPLGRLAELNEVERPSTINREWGKRLIKVQANVREAGHRLLCRRGQRAHRRRGQAARRLPHRVGRSVREPRAFAKSAAAGRAADPGADLLPPLLQPQAPA